LKKNETIFGFGCIAFDDESDLEGYPYVPFVHKLHVDIFDGNLVPADVLIKDPHLEVV
jgi:hypothetical protein